MRLVRSNPFLSFIYEFAFIYQSPSNFNYFFNFGSLAILCLVMQILTGVFLAMHYTPETTLAFSSVEHIMRDVNYGYFLRYMHANGASMFFIAVYVHIFKALFYGSYAYPRHLVWVVGVVILLLMILTAFMGYVLPWGQMSFWAATVITNFVTAVPVVGFDIVYWIWGGFSVGNPTLNRLFSLHYLFPFLILVLVVFHMVFLHTWGSNNPLGINYKSDNIGLTPYFIIKDAFGVVVFLLFASFFVFFAPNYLGHPDNYIPADPLVTPLHIVPEWYFLPFYAILRSLPGKLLGVVALVASIVVLAFLPFIIVVTYRSASNRPLYQIFFWMFVVTSLILGFVGGKPIEYPYYELGQCLTFFYFLTILGIFPLLFKLDQVLLTVHFKSLVK